VNGSSPTWVIVARWAVGILGTLLLGFGGFLAHQVLVVNVTTDARQDVALVEQRATLDAVRDYELRNLRYEITRLASSIDQQSDRLGTALDKLENRLRQQEMRRP